MEDTNNLLRRRHHRLACFFGIVLPILTHHVLQAIHVPLAIWYEKAPLNDLGESLFGAVLEVLGLLIAFGKALSLLALLGVYTMHRLRLPHDTGRRRWLRWSIPLTLLPYLASYWLIFAFEEPHWEDLGYLSLTILFNWLFDLVVLAIAVWLVCRYARRYRTQEDLSPKGQVLPRRNVPLLRLLLSLTLVSFAVHGAVNLWNTVVVLTSYRTLTASLLWIKVFYPWLLLLVQHVMAYLLLVWIAHDTQRRAPAEHQRFQK